MTTSIPNSLEREPEPSRSRSGLKSVSDEHEPLDYYFARFGTFMLTAPERHPDAAKLQPKLIAAFEADNRVASVAPIILRNDWIHDNVVYPQRRNTSDDELLSGYAHLHSILLSDPIVFTVTVPIKNQPLFRDCDDIPTDTYYVAWDGITAVVAWPREVDDKTPPRSGGHVVIDVLRDIAKRSGLGFYAQACSPACTDVFAHQVMRIERFAGGKSLSSVKARGTPCVDARLYCDGDATAVVAALINRIGNTAEQFALYKNGARRILDLEYYVRSMVDELLELDHAHIRYLQSSMFVRIKGWRADRTARHRSRVLISSLWLGFSRIEALKSSWLQTRRRLLDWMDRRGITDLFEGDKGDDDAALMSQDLAFVRSATEQTAARFDARSLAWATGLIAITALFSAIIGGLLTYFL